MKKIEVMEAFQKMLYLHRTNKDKELFLEMDSINQANTILETYYKQLPSTDIHEESLANIRSAYSLFIKRNNLYL